MQINYNCGDTRGNLGDNQGVMSGNTGSRKNSRIILTAQRSSRGTCRDDQENEVILIA